MSGGPAEQELGDPFQRTLLAWRRTALSLVAAGLLVGHLAAADAGRASLVVILGGVALVVGFVWLGGRPMAVTGLVLAAGVVLIGAIALIGTTR